MGTRSNDNGKALQELYEKGHYAECLAELFKCRPTKAVEHNKVIAECELRENADELLADLQCNEELQLDQQVLCDYNRALALGKYKQQFDDAIEILEDRLLVLTEPFGVVDQKLAFKLFYLLAVIYIERKRNLQKALNLLQIINDKCDPLYSPPNLQYMKVKCYLAMGNFKKVKKKLRFLSVEESLLVRVYMEMMKGEPFKASKTFQVYYQDQPIFKRGVEHLSNEAILHMQYNRFRSLYTISRYKFQLPPEIKYNEGQLHLITGNLKSALVCFRDIIPHFKSNPKMWLRLTECFLQNWLDEIRKGRALCRSSSILIGHVGEHMNRKAIVNSHPARKWNARNEMLILARGCALNAKMLMTLDDSELSFFPSNMPGENEMKTFRVSINLQLAYICIKLNDFHSSHRFAHEILTKQSPNSVQKVLAVLYLAESLIRMQANRANVLLSEIGEQYRESQRLLQTETKLILQDNDYLLNVREKLIDWDLDRLKFTLRYNSAVVLALQGRLTDADQEVQQLRCNYGTNFPNHAELPSQLVLLDVYLSKRLGRKMQFDCSIPATSK